MGKTNKIKGQYSGQIDISFEVDENEDWLLPFDAIKERFTKQFTSMLEEIIKKEIDFDVFAVKITQDFANVWREEAEDE